NRPDGAEGCRKRTRRRTATRRRRCEAPPAARRLPPEARARGGRVRAAPPPTPVPAANAAARPVERRIVASAHVPREQPDNVVRGPLGCLQVLARHRALDLLLEELQSRLAAKQPVCHARLRKMRL